MKTNKRNTNPFELFTYINPAYFCDREVELGELLDSFSARRNLVLSSFRRLGKTSLIKHFHYHLSKQENTISIYVDVMDTDSDIQFVNKLVAAIFRSLDARESSVSKFLTIFKNLRPQAGIDPITGLPTLSLDINSEQQITASLETVFGILAERKEQIQIAIDEFQQISNYTTKTRIDATIRSFLPHLGNVHFLFSGSEQHLLTALFADPKKPMFASTQMMTLDYIDHEPYFDFIKYHFNQSSKTIKDDAIDRILSLTDRHTFYTHFLCNNLYNNPIEDIDIYVVEQTMDKCLKQFESSYYFFEKTLSANQWKVLKALAKEKIVQYPYSRHFLNKNNLSASSTRQSLTYLVNNNLVINTNDENGNHYFLYDVFFSRWLERKK